jgi:pimeloyl-ACP methyl ester carboxylesterase
MPKVALGEVELHYEQRGRGTPLLLIAGLASDSLSWMTVAEPLAARWRTIAPDNRGVGRTTPQDAASSIDAMADDCAALLDHAGIARADVLGHSMGGFIAQRLALRHPALVRRLILAGTGAAPGAANVARFYDLAERLDAGEPLATWFPRVFEMIFTRRFLADPANAEAALRWALEYPYPQSAAGFRAQCDAIAAFEGRDDLAGIAHPALVIAGREDACFDVEECRAFATALRRGSFVVIEGAAHAIHTEQPKAFVDAVAAFLAD